MSDTPGIAPKLYTYLAIIPDLPDSKRAQVREQHLKNAKPAFEQGILIEGGATFDCDRSKHGDQARMTGSYMIVRAESEEKAREWIANDIYTTGGAWDLSRMQITSVFCSKDLYP